MLLAARDEQRGQDAVEQLKSEGLSSSLFDQLDIISSESIEKMKKFLVEKYGGLDLLVNNAGIAYKVCSSPVLKYFMHLSPTLHEKLPLTIFDSHQKCSQSWTTIFDTQIKGVGALLTLALTRVKVIMPLTRVKGEQRYL